MDSSLFHKQCGPAHPLPAAIHSRANLLPFPVEIRLAERYQSDYPIQRMVNGLHVFHHLLEALYQTGVKVPQALIPPARSRQAKAMPKPDIEVYTRLLFAIGLNGQPIADRGQLALWADARDIVDFCARARIKDYGAYLTVLGYFGLACIPSQPMQFTYPNNPDFLLALVLFAKACRPLTNKDVNPPAEFMRADMRVLEINRKKVRQVALEPEEAFRALDDERESAFVRDLDGWAQEAGYVPHVKCTNVQKSEFNAIYRLPNPAHTLYGFRTEFGRLHMHLNFNQAERILPHIAQTPPEFRQLYYARCTCAECNHCPNGPLVIELDGCVRRLCKYSYMNLPEVPAEHYRTIHKLLKVQDGLLKDITN